MHILLSSIIHISPNDYRSPKQNIFSKYFPLTDNFIKHQATVTDIKKATAFHGINP